MLSLEHDSRFESDRVSYMFRCASTYNWDVLNGYCSSSLITLYSSLPFHPPPHDDDDDDITMIPLNDEIRYTNHTSNNSRSKKERYKEKRLLPLSLFQQLVFTDQWGNTVLHQACFSKPPVDVVEMLLQIGRHTSPPVLNLASIQSRDGSTAVLVASGTGADLAVLQTLLLPPQPLLSSSTPTNKVAMSRHAWLALIPDNQGSTPLSELCNQYHLSRKYSKPISPKLANISSPYDIRKYPQLRLFFQKVKSIVQASHPLTSSSCWEEEPKNDTTNPKQTNKEEDPFFMIYTLASISHTCPVDLSALMSRLYPHCYSQRHNETKQLPLHRSLGTSLFPYLDHDIVCTTAQCSKFQYQHTKFIRSCIDTYPDAVRKAVPIMDDHSWQTNGRHIHYNQTISNNNNQNYWRSPFCHAIAAGLTWNNYYTFSDSFVKLMMSRQNDENDNEKDGSVLRCLAHVAPEALECRDTMTGLYPFMLAATIVHVVTDIPTTHKKKKQQSSLSHHEEKEQYHHPTTNNKKDDDTQLLHLAHLDTIYNLLQRSPQLVACVTTTHTHE